MIEMAEGLLLWKPKIKDTVYFNDIFLDAQGKGKWIIGETEKDTHFLLSASQKEFFCEVCELFDGVKTIEEIASSLNVSNNKILAVAKLLYENGMLLEELNTQRTVKFNEVERYSVPLVKYVFSNLKNPEKTRQIANIIWLFINIFWVLNFLLFVGLNIQSGFQLFSGVSFANLFAVGKSESNMFLGYLAVNIGMVIMFVFHELGHVLLGLKNGIQPDKFSFVLFLGFIPMFYVKNKNIYTLNKKNACSVLLAGVFINLILAFFCINIYGLWGNDLFKVLALSNMRIILINLWPLSLSDGYYIFSLLSKNPNMRMKLHYFISNPKIIFEYSKIEQIYVILAFCVMVFSIGMEIFVILSMFDMRQEYKTFVAYLFIAAYVIFLHVLEKKTLHKRRKRK